MDRRCDHASDDRRSYRLHYVGADAGLKENWNETGENGGDCHELRTEALNRAFDGSLFNIVRAMDFVREKMTVQSLVQVDDHDHAGFHRDSEERNVPDPDGHAEVIAKQPLQQQAAGQRVDRGHDKYDCFRGRAEDHVEQDEDEEEDYGQNELETLLGPRFKLDIRPTTDRYSWWAAPACCVVDDWLRRRNRRSWCPSDRDKRSR